MFSTFPIVFAASICAAVVTWAQVSSVNPAEKWPSMPDTVFMSTPFCKAMVAKVWRRSWNLTFGMPALASTRFSMLFTLSGEMGPPLGEGNTYSSLVFSFCCFRTSIACCEMVTVRQEFFVFSGAWAALNSFASLILQKPENSFITSQSICAVISENWIILNRF